MVIWHDDLNISVRACFAPTISVAGKFFSFAPHRVLRAGVILSPVGIVRAGYVAMFGGVGVGEVAGGCSTGLAAVNSVIAWSAVEHHKAFSRLSS